MCTKFKTSIANVQFFFSSIHSLMCRSFLRTLRNFKFNNIPLEPLIMVRTPFEDPLYIAQTSGVQNAKKELNIINSLNMRKENETNLKNKTIY